MQLTGLLEELISNLSYTKDTEYMQHLLRFAPLKESVAASTVKHIPSGYDPSVTRLTSLKIPPTDTLSHL